VGSATDAGALARILQSVPRPSHISPHFRYGDAAPMALIELLAEEEE